MESKKSLDRSLDAFWKLQKEQQKEFGMDSSCMSNLEATRAIQDLTMLLYEEVGELARLSPSYKRHLLDTHSPDKRNVVEELVDILKITISLSLVYGIEPEDIAKVFDSKTKVISTRATAAKFKLSKFTKLICLDMDDVITDFNALRSKSEREYRGKGFDEIEAYKDELHSKGFLRELKPIRGAITGIRKLKSMGYKIAIITARPQWQFKRMYHDTLWWLRKYKIPYDILLFNRDKVEAVYRHISPAWPIFFVEDLDRNALSLAQAGIKVLLYDTPKNKSVEHESITRVYNWKDITRLAEDNRCVTNR